MAQPSTVTPDYLNMAVSLLIVIGLIFALAMLAKRFKIGIAGQGAIKQIATLSVGAKERLIIVEIAEQQYLIGVTSQQVRLIDKLSDQVPSAMPAVSLPAEGALGTLFNSIKKGNS
jgi:flagellar protein FliO/FliZ